MKLMTDISAIGRKVNERNSIPGIYGWI